MTPELIIDLITAVFGTGGLCTIFFVSEKKARAMLENADKINEQWQLIVKQKEHDFAALNEKYEAATVKIEKLYDDNSELRNRLDSANTECAVATVMRCDCLDCKGRKPPFGSSVDVKHINEQDK